VFHPAIGIGGAAVQLDVMTHLAGYNGSVSDFGESVIRAMNEIGMAVGGNFRRVLGEIWVA
jgi:hypothetical protein